MVETAGKLAPGFLDSTVTSLGDYDGCLSVKSDEKAPVFGQYCMLDMFPTGKDEDEHKRKNIYLKSIPVFKGTPVFVGLCVPNTCSSDDVRELVKNGNFLNKFLSFEN